MNTRVTEIVSSGPESVDTELQKIIVDVNKFASGQAP